MRPKRVENLWLDTEPSWIDAYDKKGIDVSFVARGSFVYLLFLRSSLQYIGKTTSLGARIGQHKKKIEFDRVQIISVPEEKASELERHLIRRYRPKRNALHVPGYYERKFLKKSVGSKE